MLKIKSFFKNSHVRHWATILSLLALSVYTVNTNHQGSFLASVLDMPKADPFDGTVLPFAEVPDYARLSTDQYRMSYDDLKNSAPQKWIPMPLYDNDIMTVSSEGLGWSSAHDLSIRTFKILYPVGFLDNYDYSDNSGDFTGSHDGVDIKMPTGTPIRAVANGVVITAGWVSGDGNVVTIQHDRVPDPVSSSRKTTLYSSYAHASELLVHEGEVVQKGQVIAKVGQTGTATTPHLHFQLDNELSPFQPYWPFTTADARAAGVSFWDAVNTGLGRDNAMRYSAHPLKWVQEHLSDVGDVIVEPEEEEADEPVDVPEETATSVNDVEWTLDGPSQALTGENLTYTLRASVADFEGSVSVSLSDSSVASVNKSRIDSEDLSGKEYDLKVFASAPGSAVLTVKAGDRTVASQSFTVADEILPFDHFEFKTDASFEPDEREAFQIWAVNSRGEKTSDVPDGTALDLQFVKGLGVFVQEHFTKEDFHEGAADAAFTSKNNDPVQLEYIYGTESRRSEVISARIFSDVSDENPFYSAVSFLKKKEIMNGYPDGTAQLEKPISRVEVLKLIFNGVDQKLEDGLDVKFNDTSKHAWYSDYLATGYAQGIVEGYPDGSFKPSQSVSRVEFLKMLLVAGNKSGTMNLDLDPVVKDLPFNDIDTLAWYAPYVQYMSQHNLYPDTSSRFNPSAPVTRGEVAEVIYRLIVSQKNGSAPYSVLLSIAE